jgi:hypothetical protein
MKTRYFLYPIHISHTFLSADTMASNLYLLLLRILHRSYESAYKLARVCETDLQMNAEERWIFQQLEQTMDDKHPDCCALRLLLASVLGPYGSASWRVGRGENWLMKTEYR